MLQDEEAARAGLLRRIYVTSRPLGNEDSAGVMQRGDLNSDLSARIISYDFMERAYSVIRNGNPPRPEELVPDVDIGALLRSFVRDNANTGPVALTVTDTRISDQVEAIRQVIPARQIEVNCHHGPFSITQKAPIEPLVSGFVMLCALAGALAIAVVYYKFVRHRAPPPGLPSTSQYMVKKQDVRSALDRMRL